MVLLVNRKPHGFGVMVKGPPVTFHGGLMVETWVRGSLFGYLMVSILVS